ncbi:hypothetical protein [Aliidiomarina maris]|uniref:DNA-directed DNA polymerase n=1 Tax=Aliidiomarina maris TaxID=531312 RepID=A0A327X6K1_9GAMM|nr:hypothetical protein [Aliidiomarina maris]RAJ98876.1 DNA polymerase III delta' subunit [Aliidiomarina maris]RUO25023.1 hypothetical protein CWE07_05965 [Aliidiomarina maris]
MKMPWLRQCWQQIMQSAQQQRLAHGIALPWQPELGSDKLITQLSHWALCQQREHSMQACGHCKSCTLLASGHHPDFIRFGEQASDSIGVDDVRHLQQKLQQSSHQGGRKVAVLANAHMLTVAASNALLKTLEEPPGDVLIIIAPARWQSLLPTIRSRLQYYPIYAPDIEGLAQWLSQYAHTPVAAQESLRPWCAKPLLALSHFSTAQDNQAAGAEHLSQAHLHTLLSHASVDKSLATPEQGLFLISHMESLLRDIGWLAQGGALAGCRLPELCDTLAIRQWPPSHFKRRELMNAQRACQQARRMLQGPKGLNVQLALQELLIQMRTAVQPA